MGPLQSLRQHWPEHLMEAWGLGIFMVAAGVMVKVMESTAFADVDRFVYSSRYLPASGGEDRKHGPGVCRNQRYRFAQRHATNGTMTHCNSGARPTSIHGNTGIHAE